MKDYIPKEIEQEVLENWIKSNIYAVKSPKKAFSMVIPPPNVTGSLHIGHALNITIQDIVARFKRMQGFDVVWVPGFDHAGIATQFVVERELSKENKSRLEIGREEFLKRVWQWVYKSRDNIKNQVKRLGASVDWSRERFTMDEGFSRAVRYAFKKLYDEGLIKKDTYIVNWCPKDLTALSDLEVEHEEEKGKLYYIKYPVLDSDEYIVVATTRPETMLGDVAVAVNPNDERYKHLIGKKLKLPLVDWIRYDITSTEISPEIPVIADEFVDMEFGTGAVKITPAHDPNDYEAGLRQNLPIVKIMDEKAKLTKNAGRFEGLDRYEAREKIVQELKSLGLLEKEEEHIHAVGKCYRCKTTIEPMVSTQWFLKVSTKKDEFLDIVKAKKTRFIPPSWEKNYTDWIENIKDWCISRQIWWGHRIPVWECEDCKKESIYTDEDFNYVQDKLIFNLLADGKIKKIFTPKEIDEILNGKNFVHPEMSTLDFYKHFAYKKYYATGINEFSIWQYMASRRDLYKYHKDVKGFELLLKCKHCGSINIKQVEDVLDTWFSSALWPFGVFSWPEPNQELDACYPNSLLVTAFDILFFWVARMIMMSKMLNDKEPFKDVYIHALIRDEKGQKMSKTKGNVIDPIDVIEKYGADSLRFTLASLSSALRDIKLSEQKFEASKFFANKIWNAAKYVISNTPENFLTDIIYADMYEKEDYWIITALNLTIGQVTEYLENYQFSHAAQSIYNFFWNEFCDWYIEFSKLRIYEKPIEIKEDMSDEEKAKIEEINQKIQRRKLTAVGVLNAVLSKALRLLHPFMPFITSYIHAKTIFGDRDISLKEFPVFEQEAVDIKSYETIERLKRVISFIRKIKSDFKIESKITIFFQTNTSKEFLEEFSPHIVNLCKLNALEELKDPANTLSIPFEDITFYIPEKDFDRASLLKDYEKTLKDVEKQLSIYTSKLQNKNFVEKAPPEEVEKAKATQEKLQQEKENVERLINILKSDKI